MTNNMQPDFQQYSLLMTSTLVLQLTGKQQGENDHKLVDGMAEDVLHHGARDEGLVAAVGLTQQQGLGRGLGGQGQGGKGVHDQVDPQHLHRFQWRVLER